MILILKSSLLEQVLGSHGLPLKTVQAMVPVLYLGKTLFCCLGEKSTEGEYSNSIWRDRPGKFWIQAMFRWISTYLVALFSQLKISLLLGQKLTPLDLLLLCTMSILIPGPNLMTQTIPEMAQVWLSWEVESLLLRDGLLTLLKNLITRTTLGKLFKRGCVMY